jgi:hypothetical protein
VSYATIISICPAEVNASLPHTTPARISIPAGSIDEPVLCVLSDGEERKYTGVGPDSKNPWTSYPVIALDLAKCIADDFRRSATYVESEPASYPGIFAVGIKPEFVTPARHDVSYVKNNDEVNKFVAGFPTELTKAKNQQYNWFKKLVQVADRSFAKNSNYAEISNMQRYASKVLNLERPWNKEIKPEDFRKCPFCASFVEPAAVICVNCHNVVDVAKYNALKAAQEPKPLSFASQGT